MFVSIRVKGGCVFLRFTAISIFLFVVPFVFIYTEMMCESNFLNIIYSTHIQLRTFVYNGN